jgi:macrodomain Ter protein organizer (MatP/YcbG family)
MLDQDIIIKTGIEGLDPNEEEAPQLSRWLEKHQEKSAEYKQAKKARGQRFVEAKRQSVTASTKAVS